MTRPLSRLVVALGADPDVFFPVAHAHSLLVRRRAGLLRTRRGLLAKASPFRTLCFFATAYGLAGTLFVVQSKAILLGEAIAVSTACLFLLMVVVSDYIDVLVNPREQLVLGAHPHDDRSILLAKLWVVSRALFILFLLLSVPTTIAVLLTEKSVLAAALYFMGAGAAAVTATTTGLYVGVAVISFLGRKAYDRLMPWLQAGFQVSYIVFFSGRALFAFLEKGGIPPSLAWVLPPFWLLAPLEAAHEGVWTPAIVGRSLLAAATAGALFVGATRWLGARVGERMLEPIERSRRAGAVSRPRARTRPRRVGDFTGSERRRFFALFRIHMRADWKTRSEFFIGPVICAVFLATSFRERSPWWGAFLVGSFLIASTDILTRSARPESLWCILVSPIDRVRFSLASVSLLRVTQLLPMVAILGLFGWRAAGAGIAQRVLFLVEVLLYGNLILLVGRALLPDFPFSRAARADEAGGRRMAMILGGTLLSAMGTGAMWALARFVDQRALIAVAGLALLHVPAVWWTRRRVSAAAETIELVPASVA